MEAVLLHLLTVAVLAAGLSGLSVGLGACMPNFRETDPSQDRRRFRRHPEPGGGAAVLAADPRLDGRSLACTRAAGRDEFACLPINGGRGRQSRPGIGGWGGKRGVAAARGIRAMRDMEF